MKRALCGFLALFILNILIGQNIITSQVMLEELSSPNAIKRTGKIRPTSDGGFLQVGTWGTGSFAQAILLKVNAEEQIDWAFRLNVTLAETNNNAASYGADILEIDEENYLLLAAINQNEFSNEESLQNLDYGLIRFRLEGPGEVEVAYTRTFGGPFADIPHQIEPTTDGGYILSGYSNPEQALNLPSIALTYLVKVNQEGEMEWDKRLKSPGECRTDIFSLYNQGLVRRTIWPCEDGSLLFTLQCNSNVYFGKLNQNGEPLWTKSYQNSNLFIASELNEDWGAVLGAGGFGALTLGKELETGDLVFLGNQNSIFFSILGVALENPQGAGIALPMSYLLITDENGQFKNALAFFQETYNQSNLPIEMLAEDLIPLENGHFLIACHTSRFFNGTYAYKPALLELNPDIQNFDEGIIRTMRLKTENTLHRLDDYPWGLDALQLSGSPDGNNIILVFDNQYFLLNDFSVADRLEDCLEEVPFTMHTFPFELQLQDATLVSSELSVGELTNVNLSAREINQITLCSESIVESQEIETPVKPNIVLSPIPSRSGFIIHSDTYWIGAEIQLFNSLGKQLNSYKINTTQLEIPRGNLKSGLHYFVITKEAQRQVLKGILIN